MSADVDDSTMGTDLETPPCDGCGSTDVHVVFEQDSDLHAEEAFVATTDAFHNYGRIVRCVRCGLVRLSPRQRWGFLLNAYRESEDPLYLEELPGRMATARAMLRLLERRVPSGRLLDVGCGPGILLSAAKPRWQPVGVELCRWAVNEARNRDGLEVHENTLEGAAFPAATFDAVTLLDVIEHLSNPRESLREIRRVLKPGGAVFILTPDIGAPVSRLMGRWWWGLRPAHLYYFSNATLQHLLKQEGFEIAAAHHVGRRFSFGYWISRMRGYAPPLVDLAGWIAKTLRLHHLRLYLNTLDSIAVVAAKPPSP